MIYSHIADYIKNPAIIKINKNFYIASFMWMKVCSVIEIISNLIEQNIIKEGDTLVDSSSGVYAYSLALACHKYNLQCIIVGASSITKELYHMITLLGAKIHIINATNIKYSQEERINYIKFLLKQNKNYYWMQQYHDKQHYLGYKVLGEQIKQLGSNKINIIAGVGTGSSSIGTADYLNRLNINTNLIGIDIFGSISFDAKDIKDPSNAFAVGIGSGIKFNTLDRNKYIKTHYMSFDAIQYFTLKLYKEQAIFGGLSSGATYGVGMFESLQTSNEVFVSISADMGYRYFNDVYFADSDKILKNSYQPMQANTINAITPPWCYKYN